MKEKIRILTPSQVSSLTDDVDLFAISRDLNDYVKKITSRVNIQDLGEWRILISVLSLPTNKIGVLKQSRRYPSDKEYEISIAIPIPSDSQVLYGLAKVKNDFFKPLNEKFYILEPNFENYDDLYGYIFESSKRAIDLAFTKGIVCGGKKIKFQSK